MLNPSVDRNSVIENLNDSGIGAAIVHLPCHNYSCFNEDYKELPETDYFYQHQISLPCGWWLEEEDIKNISQSLEEFL